MEERLYYINNSWLTYEQAHNLGYSLLPQKKVTFYTQENESVVIKKDVSDNTYYDQPNLRWVSDFYELGLYSYVNIIKCYRGESHDIYRGYIGHITDTSISHILYNELITDLNYLYEHNGVTTYKCDNIIVDELGNPLVWYDSHTSNTKKYFDDRDDRHCWVTSIDDVHVTMYDSSTNLPKQIYEDDSNDSFYIDGSFVSRDDFYSHDNYGVIRDNAYLFKDGTLYIAYYDSYSEEYCIPNVTSIWLSREDIIALGYAFIEGVADFWLCQTPLHLPWKYLPNSAVISFTNTLYPDLAITLPPEAEYLIGTEVLLPEILGVYEDSHNIKWVPTRWDIGEFNSLYTLEEDTTANLACEKLKVTISYTNTSHPELGIPLPPPSTVDNGESVALPYMEGTYEDAVGHKWFPLNWSVGQFNSSFTVSDNTIADLVWDAIKSTLSFLNEIHPELDIEMPEPRTRMTGDTVILPRMRGVHYDSDLVGWIPMRWDLGQFDSLITLDSDKTAILIWEPLAESLAVALCGSMPSDSGSSTEAGVSLILSADGSMKLDEFKFDKKYLTDECESYGGQIEIWPSSYVPVPVPEFCKNSFTTDEQMSSGTLRKWGVNDNDYVDFSIMGSSMSLDVFEFNNKYLSEVYEVFGGQIEIWPSSYIQPNPEFPTKDVESDHQMIGGTLRKWGSYANRGMDLDYSFFAGSMSLDPVQFNNKYFSDVIEVFGDQIKIYDKPPYEPIVPVIPDKTTEPDYQMICGTIRISGNKANRGIPLSYKFLPGVDESYYPEPDEPVVVTLPTVSTTGDFGTNNLFKFAVGGGNYTFNNRVITSIYRYDNGEYGQWDSDSSYAVLLYRDYNNTYVAHTGITPYNSSDKIYMYNQTGNTIMVAYVRIAVCSDSLATVVTVYDSNNITYNAFKYTNNGTDYYLVLDNVQSHWVSDLASIGYVLV